MNKIVLFPLVIALTSGALDAQGLLKKMGDAANKIAKEPLKRKTEQKAEKAIDELVDGKPSGKKEGKGDEIGTANDTPDVKDGKGKGSGLRQDNKAVELAYARNNFVTGDEIFFADDQANEKIGEFPSQRDLADGNAEIVTIYGEGNQWSVECEIGFTGTNTNRASIGRHFLKPMAKTNTTYKPTDPHANTLSQR